MIPFHIKKKVKERTMKTIILILLLYVAVLSLLSVIFCVYDKIAAKKMPKNRVPERALFSLSALGGGCAMLACMLLPLNCTFICTPL